MGNKKSIMDMQTGITILIGIVILGGLGWLVTEVNSLGKEVTEFKTISIGNKDRMNRIGENIPQIKSVLASIEIEKALDNAFIAFRAQKNSSNNWTMNFALAEISKSELTTYEIELDSLKDDFIMMASSGTIMNSQNSKTLSFHEYEKFSDSYIEFPSNINVKNSWIISGSANEIINLLNTKSKNINKTELVLKEKNLKSLIDSLKVQ